MDKSFWMNKWQAGEIGFHLADVHPWLVKYHKDIFPETGNLFVPLCGKTNDLRYLSEQGHRVLGVELCEMAAQSFFSEHFPDTKISKRIDSDFTRYAYNNIEIMVGDYFKLPQPLDDCCYIYDRAALVALPNEMRKAYVKKMLELCPSAHLILITLDYQQSQMDGPPFSVDEEEVNQLFNFAKIKQLHRQDLIDKEPRFQSKGLKSFNQTLYHICW